MNRIRAFMTIATTRDKARTKLRLVLLAVALTALTTSAIASRLYTRHTSDSEVPVTDSGARGESVTVEVIPHGKPNPTLTQSVLLTITPRGFDVKEVTVPEGPFFLLVENRSGLSDMSLSLQAQGGGPVISARVQREELDWAQFLDLPPGNYVISEASHPQDLCQLTVTSK